jgi:hypothetical protein
MSDTFAEGTMILTSTPLETARPSASMAAGSGRKYGFWIQIRFFAQQIAHVVEDLHGGRASFRLHPSHMNWNIAGGWQIREHILADDQFAGFLDPVFAERRLDGMNGRAGESYGDVTVLGSVRILSEPTIMDAMPADDCNPAVKHDNFSVVSFIEYTDVAQTGRMVEIELAACRLEPAYRGCSYLLSAVGIHQNAHGKTGTRAISECLDQKITSLSLLP